MRNLVAARLAADVMGVPTAARRAHRRRRRQPPHERRRRARPAVPHRRAHRRRASTACAAASTRRSRAAWPTPPTPTCIWCETSDAEPRRGARASPRAIHAAVPRQAAGLQLLALVQLEEEARRRDHRRVPARARARWATSSSSSRWPASTRSTTACSTWRTATRTAAWPPTPSCSRRSSPPRRDGYTATRHQREVGTGYFDEVAQVIAGGESSTTALAGSTEEAQFAVMHTPIATARASK